MRKRLLSLLALALILTMTLPLFAACGDGEQGTEEESKTEVITFDEVTPDTDSGTESKTELETDAFPDIEQQNYGKEFYMWITTFANKPEYHWVEKGLGDTMSEAIYHRQEQVRQYLGVEIIAKSEGGSTVAMVDPFKSAVKAKDDSVQLLVSHSYGGLTTLLSGNYMTTYDEMPEIDLDASYWSSELMDNISINGKVYLGKSDFNILATHVVAFNKELMAKYEDQLGGTVYELVDNCQWTVDRMISLSNMAYIDATGDGKTKDDILGLSCEDNVPLVGFLQASNINVVEPDEKGDLVVSLYQDIYAERTVGLMEKLKGLMASNSAWLPDWYHNAYPNHNELKLYNGRILMTLEATNNLETFTSYELALGILPYPMYDETQKDVGYRHLQWGGYLVFPGYLSNRQMAGETVELLSYYSEAVNEAYYEKLLGKQASDMPEDSRMLELVWSTICSDYGQLYCELGSGAAGKFLLFAVPNLLASGDSGVASYVASYEKVVNRAIEKFIETVKKQQK